MTHTIWVLSPSDTKSFTQYYLKAMKYLVNTCNSTAQQHVRSAKIISVRVKWLRQNGRAPSEPSETPRWRITPRPASIACVALHIALQSQFHRFFWLYQSPILNENSGVMANCDHMSEWVHWVRACIGIAMQWVTLRKPLLASLQPAHTMEFSLR